MEKEDFLNKRFIVYFDEKYHHSWIYPEVTKKIIKYFSSEERKDKKFEILDAQKVNRWIIERIKKNDAYKSCIVFSQDMVPEVLAPDYSPSIILRTYLDRGGRIIWIGDIPFYRKGKPYKDLIKLQPEEIEKNKNQIWDEWGIAGIFSILNLNVEFNYSPTAKVEITELGKQWGLKPEHSWYGTRPVTDPSNSIKILAQSSAYRYKPPELIKPEEKQQSTWRNILEIFLLINTTLTIILGVAAGISSVATVTSGFPLPLLILSAFLIVSFISSLSGHIFRRFRRKKYASAWIMNFNKKFPNSGFIRMWDYIIYDIEEDMLDDLFTISTYDF